MIWEIVYYTWNIADWVLKTDQGLDGDSLSYLDMMERSQVGNSEWLGAKHLYRFLSMPALLFFLCQVTLVFSFWDVKFEIFL